MVVNMYRLTSPSGKQYIGVTSHPIAYRLKQHSYAKTAIGSAVRKYGLDSIVCEVLVAGTEDYIYSLEDVAINTFKTRFPAGYNVCEGGMRGPSWSGKTHTMETKEKMSAATRGQTHSTETRVKIAKARTGRIASSHTRKKMSEAHSGKSMTEETRGNMSSAQRRRFLGSNGHTEKTKQAISEGQRRRWAETKR